MTSKIYTAREREKLEAKGHALAKHAGKDRASKVIDIGTEAPEEAKSLAILGDATRMLAEVRDAPSAKKLMDLASAAKHYAKKAKLGEEAVKLATGIEVEAKRRLGLFLQQREPPQGRPAKKNAAEGFFSERGPSNAALGISPKISAAAQKLAAIPEATFERVRAGEITERQAVTALNRTERTEKLAEISKGNADLGIAQRYPVIYADPPWRYEHVKTENRAIENHYPTMDLEDIKALPVLSLATDDAILFMWATSPKLAESMFVVEAWGFTYRTCMVWVKDKIGMGYYARQRHEILLIATRGNPPTPPENARPDSVIESPLARHSAKPAAFAEAIERMYPTLPKIEMFCRSPRDGWAAWGNQS